MIGSHWQGNPQREQCTSHCSERPMETFAVLAERMTRTLLPLQKGFAVEQRHSCSFQPRVASRQTHVDDTWDFAVTRTDGVMKSPWLMPGAGRGVASANLIPKRYWGCKRSRAHQPVPAWRHPWARSH